MRRPKLTELLADNAADLTYRIFSHKGCKEVQPSLLPYRADKCAHENCTHAAT